MKRRPFFKLPIIETILALAALLMVGAKEDSKESDPKDPAETARLKLPAATINDTALTLEFVESVSSKQNPMFRKELESNEKRMEFLNKIINMELLAAEAQRRGYRKHQELASVTKNQLASLMHRKIAESIDEVEPTEEELKAYYDAHLDSYRKPEKVRARHILLKDQAAAKKLLNELKSKKISQHEFRRIAQEQSEDEATKMRGGDLTFFTSVEDRKEDDPKIDPAIVEAAFKTKKNGEIFPKLVNTEVGHHIIMRTGHRAKMDLSFEEAKNRLTTLVRRDNRKNKIEAAINALKERYEVEVLEENLKHVVIDLSGGPRDPDAKGGPDKRGARSLKKFPPPKPTAVPEE
ncbi:MAG: peptidylprolyl isomerase [Myxococcota bacterium]|nr:peptidylprolyl isomerase [Myxococcota bacterium]